MVIAIEIFILLEIYCYLFAMRDSVDLEPSLRESAVASGGMPVVSVGVQLSGAVVLRNDEEPRGGMPKAAQTKKTKKVSTV